MTCCKIWETFDWERMLIKEYRYWKLLLRNRNTTLGNCVAITKQHHERFSELSREEMAELYDVVVTVEQALKKAFDYDIMNYLMLMLVDKHTHFHIIPRYSSPKEFAGIEWSDTDWPKPTSGNKEPAPTETLEEVKAYIRKHL